MQPHRVSDHHLDRLARRRVGMRLGWLSHAAVYLTVNTGLLVLAYVQGRHWAIYPLLGWGLGLACHGAAVFLFAPGARWVDGMVARERARLEQAR
jgi:hypothetical protein